MEMSDTPLWKRVLYAKLVVDYLMNLLQELCHDADKMDGAGQVCSYGTAMTAADLQKQLTTWLALVPPPEGPAFECERCASRITPLIYDEQDNMWFGLCTFCEEALNITSAGQVVSRAPLRKVLRDLVLKGDESIGQ